MEAMRQSQSVRWAWGGVVAKELEWVAERAACMGRGKTKWLRTAVRGLRRVLVVANGRQQEAMQLWLEYRGTFSRVSADEPGAYACSCCKRWSRVVFVTGETGGKGDGAELADAMVRSAKAERDRRSRPQS